MDLRRREFLRLAGLGLAAAGLEPGRLLSLPGPAGPQDPALSPLWPQLADDEFPFPYDPSTFLCAERVFNLRPNRGSDSSCLWWANLNLLPHPDMTLDIKVYVADSREGLATTNVVHSFMGVKDSLTVSLEGFESDRLYYQVQYRSGQGSWASLSPKSFRLPNARLSKGGQVRVLIITDDHTFDDADPRMPASHKDLMLSGDYVNEFLKGLRGNPNWLPSAPLQGLPNGLTLARIMLHILTHEDPDFIINLGDTNGIGSSYRWKALGLPAEASTESDKDLIARTLWLRMRKIFSALTPSLPMFIALGNHDGEESWNSLRTQARLWRNKYFPMPTDKTYAEGGHSQGNYYAFTWGADEDGKGGAEFIFLDCTGYCGSSEPRRVEEWTLGGEQLDWLGQVLKNREKHWILPCFHHVLGGWPAGPDESRRDVSYGRGPLFLAQDYEGLVDPQAVEQVRVTDMARQAGVSAFLYGHDHIFHHRQLAKGWNGKMMHSFCCGSSKYIGEVWWWQGIYWRKFYGETSAPDASFFGPSGYTRLGVTAEKITADYISPPGFGALSPAGADHVQSRVVLDNPPPFLKADPPSLEVMVEQGLPGRVDLELRVKNEGAGGMEFSLSPSQPWIACTPGRGKSWGEWEAVTVSFKPRRLAVGEHKETLTIRANGVDNSPLEIPLNITVLPQVLLPPQGLQASWKKGADGRDYVLLSWKPNRDNRDLSRYHVYLATAGGAPRLLAARPVNRCNHVYSAGPRRRLTFLVTAVNLYQRESEPAVITVE